MVDSLLEPSTTRTMWLWRAMIVLGWAMILSGLVMFGWECLMWLRDGYWSRVSLADLWGHVPFGGDGGGDPPGWREMRGLHMLLYATLHWLGRVPISLALFLLGLALAWIGSGQHDHAERALARRTRGHAIR